MKNEYTVKLIEVFNLNHHKTHRVWLNQLSWQLFEAILFFNYRYHQYVFRLTSLFNSDYQIENY